MKKYELSRQTHKMTIVLRLKLYKILLYTARIAYENTYDMREVFVLRLQELAMKILAMKILAMKLFWSVHELTTCVEWQSP